MAKASANPVAAMTSVPLQFNWDRGAGLDGRSTQFTLNVQPVIPVSLDPEWNLITRVIVPVLRQPEWVAGQGAASGVGDLVLTAFLSPAKASGLIWGVGPVLVAPSATQKRLGADQWAVGPSVVMLVESGNWSYGSLANHLLRVSGGEGRTKINATFLNPFASYRLGQGWSATLAPEYTYNWEGQAGKKVTFPMVGVVSKVTRIGGQMLSVGVGYKHYLQSPDERPDHGFRLALTFLFPH
ncbi:transporter [Roseateles sp. BYS180W]|uniref:Transporter n=1 Tax=Roseateles rivi TaxID=3299028 RepID=A0ABW7FR54_9BURK